jgi:hypothetical protein
MVASSDYTFEILNYGSSEPEYYRGCESGNPDALRATMGLSGGWGGTYGANTVGQYLDITGLPDGRYYRLRVTADGNSADGTDRSGRATRPTTPPGPTCR